MPARRRGPPVRSTGRAAAPPRGSATRNPGGPGRPLADLDSRLRGLDGLGRGSGGELDMSPNEPARDAGALGRAQDVLESLLRSSRDAHEDLVRAGARDRALRLVEMADHADPEDAASPDARVVVEEADDALVAALAQLAGEAATRAARAHDEHARPLAPRAESLREQPERESGRADEQRAQDRVDDEDLERGEGADRPECDEDEVGRDRRREAADGDRDDVAG